MRLSSFPFHFFSDVVLFFSLSPFNNHCINHFLISSFLHLSCKCFDRLLFFFIYPPHFLPSSFHCKSRFCLRFFLIPFTFLLMLWSCPVVFHFLSLPLPPTSLFCSHWLLSSFPCPFSFPPIFYFDRFITFLLDFFFTWISVIFFSFLFKHFTSNFSLLFSSFYFFLFVCFHCQLYCISSFASLLFISSSF